MKDDKLKKLVVPFGAKLMVKVEQAENAGNASSGTTCRTGAPPNQGVDTDDQ